MPGHIRRRTDRHGKPRWQARWIGPDRREHAATFGRKVDAERWLVEQESQTHRGEWVAPARGRTLFATYAAEVMASRHHVRPSTAARDKSIFRNHLEPAFGEFELGAITPSDVQAFVNRRTATHAPATVAKLHQLLSSIMAAAVRDRLIVASPCADISLPRAERTEMRFLSLDELGQLLETIDPTHALLAATAAYSGLRWGELAGLQVKHLDVLRRRVTVAQALSEVQGEVSLGPTKTAAARRSVTLPRTLSDELAAHVAAREGLVFTAPGGGPMRRTNFRRRVWLPAVAAAGLEGVRFHDLRHTHTAMLIAEGAHPKTIQSRLGHSSIRVTLDLYGHLFDGLDEAAADALDAGLASLLTDKRRTSERSHVVPIKGVRP